MKYVALFFIMIKIFYFFNYRIIHQYQENLMRYVEADEADSGKFSFTGLYPSVILGFLLSDILFLAYCIFLMFNPVTKTPGILLLSIDTLHTAAVHYRIKGACYMDTNGYTYPTIWFRYLSFGATIYILFNLYENI